MIYIGACFRVLRLNTLIWSRFVRVNQSGDLAHLQSDCLAHPTRNQTLRRLC